MSAFADDVVENDGTLKDEVEFISMNEEADTEAAFTVVELFGFCRRRRSSNRSRRDGSKKADPVLLLVEEEAIGKPPLIANPSRTIATNEIDRRNETKFREWC